jgi:hypothetical protein
VRIARQRLRNCDTSGSTISLRDAHIGNSQSIQRARAREREREGGREGEGEREGERERAAAEGRQVDRREIVRGRII